MGDVWVQACYAYPQNAYLMPDFFKPTDLTAASFEPGVVRSFNMVLEWANPARLANGSEVVRVPLGGGVPCLSCMSVVPVVPVVHVCRACLPACTPESL